MKTFKQYTDELEKLQERGELALATLMALSPFSAAAHNAKHSHSNPAKEVSSMTTTKPSIALINAVVNNLVEREGFRPTKYPDKGHFSIGYGHQIKPGENFNAGITKDKAIALLRTDVLGKIDLTKKLIPDFDTLPLSLQVALVDGVYRGDLPQSPKTLSLIKNGNWLAAATEYLNSREYRKAKEIRSGVAKRMEQNAMAMLNYGKLQQVPDETPMLASLPTTKDRG